MNGAPPYTLELEPIPAGPMIPREKKAREHAAGRAAAFRALAGLTGLGADRFRIERSERAHDRGRPEVLLDGERGLQLFVSISHTAGLAAAVAAHRPIGVDLEQIVAREPSFEELIASEEELETFAHLEGSARDRAVTLLWCTKEALAKRLGVGLSRPFVELDGRAPAVRGSIEHNGSELALVIIHGAAPAQIEHGDDPRSSSSAPHLAR